MKPPAQLEMRSDILEIARACERVSGINLATGIPSTPANPAAVEGAVSALYAGQSAYSDSRGVAPLRAAIAHRLRVEQGLRYDSEREVLVTSGVTGGFAACMLSLFAKGDEVVVFEPFFGWHVRLLRLAGLTPRFVRFKGPEEALDVDALRAAIGPRTRGLVLCTPNNPSGKVWTEEELGQLGALAREAGLLVISDEQYADFCFDGRRHRSPAGVEALRHQTVVLGGFSKNLSITGWRMAYAAAPPQLLEAIRLMHQTLYICPATPLQHGVARALEDLDLSAERAQLQEKRDRLCAALRDAGFAVQPPEGGFFVMADAAPLSSLPSRELAVTLLERAGVAAVPGRAFFADGEDSTLLRFCFARPMAVLDEACRRLRAMAPGALSPQPKARQMEMLEVDIRPITAQHEVDAAAALAYSTYVEQMGILGDLADHDQRRLYADDDAGATVLGAFRGGRMVGCVTLMLHADAPFPEFYDEVFQIERFEALTPRAEMSIVTRLLVDPELQGSTLASQLMGMALLTAMSRGVRLFFADSQPHLVPLYERVGLHPYGQPFNYGESGVGVTLVGGTFERERVTRIHSPMAPLLPPDSDDPALSAHLIELLGDARPIYSERSTPAAYREMLTRSVPTITDRARGSIFQGFGPDEVLRILERGYILDSRAGIKLISEGQKTRTVYVVLEGELEVRVLSRQVRLAEGAILGEIAYLTGGLRTADVLVVSERARVLCLGEKAMRALSEGEPALASRFLGNLARTLAQRMAER